MKKFALAITVLAILGCKDYEEDIRGIPDPAEVEAAIEDVPDVEEQAELLKDKGYETFLFREEDTTYLMQQ